MKLRSRIRGPKLRIKLILLAGTLLVVPWLSYLQLVEMERLLIQGQQNAQLLMASGVSTLFNNRDELFNDLPLNIDDYDNLYAHPLRRTILLNGFNDDWGELPPTVQRTFGTGDGGFELAMAEHVNQLYAFVTINDEHRIYRDPGLIDIDTSDHLRISYIDSQGLFERIVLTFSRPGVATVYRVDDQWKRAGVPLTNLRGYLRETEEGYAVEFSLPLSMLALPQKISIAFADVDDDQQRIIASVTETSPSSGQELFNLVIFRSEETMNLIESLNYVNARVLVVDTEHRIRGESLGDALGQDQESASESGLAAGFASFRPYLHRIFVGETWESITPEESMALENDAIASALSGEPFAVRKISKSGTQTVMATYPIRSKGGILGAVAVEQDIEQILSFQREALEQIVLVSLAALSIVILAAVGYALRLAYRIRRLRRSANEVIDEHGRITGDSLDAETTAGDEIGDLARSMENMLFRLRQHNAFLAKMPRTLRHEINNPLNTLTTSLENLTSTQNEKERERYIESARRGVMRIGGIVQGLAEAASIEDSMTDVDFEVVDMQKLLANYVANQQIAHPDVEIEYRGRADPVLAEVSDFHIEQLLDKILDNAIDFHRNNSPIKIQLDKGRWFLRVSVANRGPVLPTNTSDLFESLVSQRAQQDQLHFGLGLYVARVIAQYHQGTVRAINLVDGSGVAIAIELPLARRETTSEMRQRSPDQAA